MKIFDAAINKPRNFHTEDYFLWNNNIFILFDKQPHYTIENANTITNFQAPCLMELKAIDHLEGL